MSQPTRFVTKTEILDAICSNLNNHLIVAYHASIAQGKAYNFLVRIMDSEPDVLQRTLALE